MWKQGYRNVFHIWLMNLTRVEFKGAYRVVCFDRNMMYKGGCRYLVDEILHHLSLLCFGKNWDDVNFPQSFVLFLALRLCTPGLSRGFLNFPCSLVFDSSSGMPLGFGCCGPKCCFEAVLTKDTKDS